MKTSKNNTVVRSMKRVWLVLQNTENWVVYPQSILIFAIAIASFIIWMIYILQAIG